MALDLQDLARVHIPQALDIPSKLFLYIYKMKKKNNKDATAFPRARIRA